MFITSLLGYFNRPLTYFPLLQPILPPFPYTNPSSTLLPRWTFKNASHHHILRLSSTNWMHFKLLDMTCKTLLFWLLSPCTNPISYHTSSCPFNIILTLSIFYPIAWVIPCNVYVLSTYSTFQGSTRVSYPLWSLLVSLPRTPMLHISRISLTLYQRVTIPIAIHIHDPSGGVQ